MAIPNDYIDKITNKDSGESRIISPAADKVRVDNENFEGTDLDEVLDEVAQAIGESGSGDGTVTGVKVGSTTYEPTDGVVDLSTPFGGKVDKNGTDSLMTAAEHTKLQNLPTADQLTQQLGTKANDADVVKSITVNNVAQQKTNGNVNIVVPSGGLTESDISVETQGDGTVDINVGNDTYSINLNHTHEGMAKLVITDEEPSNPAMDTIYAQVDDAEAPGEIQSLWIAGLEFVGGGAAPGTPRLVKPSQTQISNGIDIGNTTSGVATYSLNIKAKDLTQSLIVELSNSSTGYSFDTSDLPTGVSYDSGTGKLTITKEAATAINGVDIPVVYTGSDSDENAEGTLGISSSSVDGIDVEVTLIANKVTIVNLAGVKLTGTQWGQTDYNVNVNTKVSMRLKFTENANTIAGDNNTNKNYYFLTCYTLSSSSKQFAFYAYKSSSTVSQLLAIVPTTPPTVMEIPHSSFLTDDSLLEVGLQSMKFTPNGGTAITESIGATATMDRGPMTIGLYHSSSGTDSIFNWYDLTIYELTITENDVVKRHYTPVTRNGVPGLLDSETGHFMSSKTSTEFVAIPLT